MRDAMISAVLPVLVTHGWTALNNSTAIASKTFDSAVGRKEAHVYLYEGSHDPYNGSLSGDYLSEGNNVLSTAGGLLPKPGTPEVWAAIALQFVQNAEKAIGDSYAVRLLRKYPEAYATPA